MHNRKRPSSPSSSLPKVQDSFPEADLDNHFEEVQGPCDSLFTPDKHYLRIYNTHLRARTHSYVNIAWTLFTFMLSIYFGTYLFLRESSLTCIAAKKNPTYLPVDLDLPIHHKFDRISSLSSLSVETLSQYEYIQDVSSQF